MEPAVERDIGRTALGRLLADHRGGAGWTQRRLASVTFVDRSYVAHAESGRAVPGRRFWSDADTALGAGGTLVSAFDVLDRATGASRRAQITDRTEPDHPRASTADAADRSLAFANRVVMSNVSDESLEHLQWEVGRLAVAYVHSDLDAVFADLVAVRDVLFALIEGRQRPRDTRELFFLTGATCLLLAHGSQNLGDERGALAQLRCAWTCVDQIDHPELRAWSRGTAALIAEWSSRPAKAVELAGEALESAPTGACRPRLAAIQARAAARTGDRATALAAAALVADCPVEPAAADGLALLGGLLTFPDAKRQYYLGGTFALLGDHERAREHAAAAVQLYEHGPVNARSYGDEALARLDITRACLHAGDLHGARAAVAPVLALPQARRIRQLDTALASTDAVLRTPALARHAEARELIERIGSYRREGHVRALSSGA